MTVMVNKVPHDTWDQTLLARWRKVPVAVIADVSEGRCQIDPKIRPLMPPGHQPKLFGFAVTAHCEPPDFGAVLHALDDISEGDVLVIAAAGRADHAMLGEILGGVLLRKKAAGIICDGAIRDVAELAGFTALSVYTRHITPRGPTAVIAGAVNTTVTIGTRRIAPGDLVIGDDDGLACMSPMEANALIDKAEAKLSLETEWQRRLAAGESLNHIFGLQAKA
jgi:4-hydroxy-4-methyl-2-oxoglutarate aldolase